MHCAFVFDRDILEALPSRHDRRLAFIRESLVELDARLGELGRAAGGPGGGLTVVHGSARQCLPALARQLGVGCVIAAEDYEPAAKARDAAVARALAADGIASVFVTDQVVFPGDAVRSQAGRPYTVFTPYRKAWLARLAAREESDLAPHPVTDRAARLQPPRQPGIPSLEALGFAPLGRAGLAASGVVPGTAGGQARLAAFLPRLAAYAVERDFPARDATSRLSVHLRFGTLSIRELVRAARAAGSAGEAWLAELIWREFFFMILDRFPHVASASFRPAYDRLAWEDAPQRLTAWQAGQTGYPLVDAAMRELRAHGTMPNRLRMLTAAFLSKHLGIDWRLGERHFAAHLLDYDLAANNGGWQWSASTGCDAQPWFRIFNPVTQSEKFDPAGAYIRRHVPELAALPGRAIHAPWRVPPLQLQAAGVVLGRDYPPPLVDHAAARAAALARFAALRETAAEP